MTKQQSLLSSLGNTLREVATDLTGVSDTLSALKVVAEQDRLTPRTLELAPARSHRGERRDRAVVRSRARRDGAAMRTRRPRPHLNATP
jgi:hypothetical protein